MFPTPPPNRVSLTIVKREAREFGRHSDELSRGGRHVASQLIRLHAGALMVLVTQLSRVGGMGLDPQAKTSKLWRPSAKTSLDFNRLCDKSCDDSGRSPA